MKKIVIILLSCLLIGCVSQQFPRQNHYMLNVKMQRQKVRTNKILKVNDAAIVPEFSGLSFIYRTTTVNYIHDYYNLFFNAPEQQINDLIIRYLTAAKLFKYVAAENTTLHANYVLQPKILELYADYRNSSQPCAVMSINFTLTTAAVKPHLVFSRTFTARVPLQYKSSKALVLGWNHALQRILSRLTPLVS